MKQATLLWGAPLAIFALLSCDGMQASPTIFAARCCTNGSTVSVISTSSNSVSSAFASGNQVGSLAFSPDGSIAYLVDTNHVYVMNVSSNQVTATIPVGTTTGAVAITPDGKQLYVGLNAGLAVISTSSNAVAKTILRSVPTTGLAVTPNGKKVYIENPNPQPAPPPPGVTPAALPSPGTVSVVDTSTNTVTQNIAGAYVPTGPIAIAPDGRHAYFFGILPYFGIATYIPAEFVVDTALDTIRVLAFRNTFYTSIAISSDGTRLFGGQSAGVDVFSTATGASLGQVALPVAPHQAATVTIAVTPDGSKLYAASNSLGNPYAGATDTVTAINLSTLTVSGSIPVGSAPSSVTITPDGLHVYVTNSQPSQLLIADGATEQVTAVNALMDEPFQVAIARSLGSLYVSSPENGTVSVVNTQSNATTAIALQSQGHSINSPRDLVVSPDQGTVYAAVYTENPFGLGPSYIAAISTSSNSVINNSVPTSNQIIYQSLAISPDGSTLYVPTDVTAPSIALMNATSLAVTQTIPLPAGLTPEFVAVTPNGQQLYVTAYAGSSQTPGAIYAVNVASQQVVATLQASLGDATPTLPRVVVTPDGSQAWIADGPNNQILVVSTATNTFLPSISIPGGPNAFAFSQDGSMAYVSTNANSIAVVNLGTGHVTGSIPTGGATQGIAID